MRCNALFSVLKRSAISNERKKEIIDSLVLSDINSRTRVRLNDLFESGLYKIYFSLYSLDYMSEHVFLIALFILFQHISEDNLILLINIVNSTAAFKPIIDRLRLTNEQSKLLFERAIFIRFDVLCAKYINTISELFRFKTIRVSKKEANSFREREWRVINAFLKNGVHMYILKPNIDTQKKASKVGVITFESNSCYVDVLLTIFFKSESSFWRRALLESKITTEFRNPELICYKDSKIKTNKDLYQLAVKVRHILKTSKIVLKEGENIVCTPLRFLLKDCLLDIKSDGRWNTFSASELYVLFAELFPSLFLHFNSNRPIPVVQLDTYFNNDRLPDIEWNKYNYHILTIQNGGIPAYRILNSKTTEEFEGNLLVKDRKLGEYILNNRYRLDGVVVLEGTEVGKAGGIHYVSYVRTKNGWYYYNDIGPVFKRIKELPTKGVFIETDGMKPEMFFYSRV